MAQRESACVGCLLGMAVGDAMGYTVDSKSWKEICEDYGPNGLLGYDLANGGAEVSSYTQIGAYAANGLLLGITRGRADLYVRFLQQAMKEWCRRQDLPRDPEEYSCWVSHISALRRRHCRDSWMLDALRAKNPGTMESPINRSANPGSMLVTAMVALLSDDKRMDQTQLSRLAASAVATTHGAPEVWHSGAVLANVIAGILAEEELPMKELFLRAIETVELQFPKTEILANQLKRILDASREDPQSVMEDLRCDTAGQCLAGAMYACLVSQGDFDTAMILAVNHSGKSAAVGAITGAILGAYLGQEALPEFYLESLEVVDVLTDLARDLAQGTPTMGLFDDDWDHKYNQGLPVGQC